MQKSSLKSQTATYIVHYIKIIKKDSWRISNLFYMMQYHRKEIESTISATIINFLSYSMSYDAVRLPDIPSVTEYPGYNSGCNVKLH